MNITSKSRYALKIMLDLAQSPDGRAQRGEIASRQGVPADYMDHIVHGLKASGLVKSIRGRGGGYKLARPANEVSVWEIFSAVEETVHLVQCLDEHKGCLVEQVCTTKDAWGEISRAIKASLSGLILDDLAQKSRPSDGEIFAFPNVQECRAPKRSAGGSN